jgi:hypothetical protein
VAINALDIVLAIRDVAKHPAAAARLASGETRERHLLVALAFRELLDQIVAPDAPNQPRSTETNAKADAGRCPVRWAPGLARCLLPNGHGGDHQYDPLEIPPGGIQ